MTASPRLSPWILATALLTLAFGASCISPTLGEGAVSITEVKEAPGFEDDRTIVEVVTTQVGGKNIFIPSTIVMTAGSGRSLSFYNTTDTPHGLKIPALGIETVLQPGVEQLVELPELEAGGVHAVQCHLHPPHRSATLLVLPAD